MRVLQESGQLALYRARDNVWDYARCYLGGSIYGVLWFSVERGVWHGVWHSVRTVAWRGVRGSVLHGILDVLQE